MDPATPRRISRRAVLATSAAATAATLGTTAATDTPAGAGPTARTGRWPGAAGSSGVRLRWLGNNGWEISFTAGGATRTVLIDPWLTRFKTGTYTPRGADPDTPLRVDTALIDGYHLKADQILVTHGHYDHMTDVPHLARTTGATVLGTESHLNMLRALDAPGGQLSVVRGGEYLQYDGYTIQVLRSLHSMTGPRAQVPFPGTRPGAVPARPRVIADLVEGETLAYQITVGERFRIIDFGGSNFIAGELAGLVPDLALIPPGGASIHRYVPRLLAALDYPTYVVPTHWDDFDYPLSQPARDWGGLAALRQAVREASPATRFVRLDHLQTFVP